MLLVYTFFRELLLVGVLFTFILLNTVIINANSMPLPLHASKQLNENNTMKADSLSGFNQHLTSTPASNQVLIRVRFTVVSLVVIFLLIVMLLCYCSTQWCSSWVTQWSATHFLGRLINRNVDAKPKGNSDLDLPPSYDFIIASKVNAVENNEEYDEDNEPPTYTEALMNINIT